MINTISVGPPQAGMTELKSLEKNSSSDITKGLKPNAKSDFSSALDQKMKIDPVAKQAPQRGPEKTVTNESLRKKELVKEKDEGKDETSSSQAGLGLPTKKSQRQREEQIQKFMDSFESEFGIPSTRIVENFSQLSKEDLEKAPEESADIFLSKFQLDAEDEAKAKAMYLGMLGQLQQIDQKAQVPYVVPVDQNAFGSEFAQGRSQAVLDKKLLTQSKLEQMNQKFWMKAPEVPVYAAPNPEAMEAAILAAARAGQADDQMPTEEILGSSAALKAQSGLEAGKLPDHVEMKIQQQVARLQAMDPSLSPQQAEQLVKEMRTEQMERSRMKWSDSMPVATVGLSAQMSQETMKPQMKTIQQQDLMMQNQVNASEQNFKNVLSQDNSGQSSFQSSQDQMGMTGNNSGDKAEKISTGKKGDFDSTLASLGASAGLGRAVQSHHVGDAQSLAAAGPVPTENKEMPLNQVMNQAQYLIKKGGGEMKVKLSPEGMGELHLKVIVQDGKVSMSMAADSAETKKLLESNVSDLKHTLASHKLSVDSIKIDTVTATQTDNNAQNSKDSMNFNQQQGRDTKQFWNNFQENFGNRGQKDSFFDTPNLRSYGKKQDPLQPLDSSVSSAKAQRTDGRGQGLDLVA